MMRPVHLIHILAIIHCDGIVLIATAFTPRLIDINGPDIHSVPRSLHFAVPQVDEAVAVMLHPDLFPKQIGHPINGRLVIPDSAIKHHEAFIAVTGIRVSVQVLILILIAIPHLHRIRIQQLFRRVLPQCIQSGDMIGALLLQLRIRSLFQLFWIFIDPVVRAQCLNIETKSKSENVECFKLEHRGVVITEREREMERQRKRLSTLMPGMTGCGLRVLLSIMTLIEMP